ncbi:Alginate biosynthesis transcriptional regulatory protein AlgB [Pontiella desulfatans]|uniref:Alginate biosynthesis transcriptional regulatory protein AlgB n=1 Tax=Pontiella desulfatans TaxID=2750659 RepID=A0A6C2UA27_PONDE|nr:response regulator [Pontiella desulfatans]VGO16948.1 Alginate biosynthesis transcriptional regulatory protein AlgB [Pontiella desulfatans]
MNDYSNIRVLVVDDEPGIRDSLSAFLDDYGFDAMGCGSTEEARDLMIENTFDVCVVDLRLPGLSGEDLILLASKRFPSQRYIIHTGSISYNLPQELRAIGMRPEHVFHKPVRVLSMLVKRIKELAENPAAQLPLPKLQQAE